MLGQLIHSLSNICLDIVWCIAYITIGGMFLMFFIVAVLGLISGIDILSKGRK